MSLESRLEAIEQWIAEHQQVVEDLSEGKIRLRLSDEALAAFKSAAAEGETMLAPHSTTVPAKLKYEVQQRRDGGVS